MYLPINATAADARHGRPLNGKASGVDRTGPQLAVAYWQLLPLLAFPAWR